MLGKKSGIDPKLIQKAYSGLKKVVGKKKDENKKGGNKKPFRTKEIIDEKTPKGLGYESQKKGMKITRTNPITGRKVEKSRYTEGTNIPIPKEERKLYSVDKIFNPRYEVKTKTVTKRNGDVKEKKKETYAPNDAIMGSRRNPHIERVVSSITRTKTKNGKSYEKTIEPKRKRKITFTTEKRHSRFNNGRTKKRISN